MAFVPWKDRVTATPHRYKLTEVGANTYDLEAVPGAVSEAGTPVNATNLDRLIQRDGDDIKDTVVAFTEAGARANIATGESTATLFGKIKKYFTDLKTHAFTTPSATQGTGTDTVPSDKLLKESSFARVYRSLAEIDASYTGNTPIPTVYDKMVENSMAVYKLETIASAYPDIEGVCEIYKINEFRGFLRYTKKTWNSTTAIAMYFGSLLGTAGHAGRWSGWKQIIDDSTAQTISAIKTYSVSPLVPTTPSGPSAAVAKSYADSLRTVYDKVIRTQTEFDALIASGTWLDAKSVAIVGQFTLSTTDNSGVKIPATVKQIHGFNSAKITVTNFLYNSSTAKGGLWYDTAPTTNDYSIRDLEVSCTGTPYSSCFYNCNNLSNCTSTGTGGEYGRGFYYCNNISNCTGTGTGTTNGSGFTSCNNISNCTGTGTGATNGYGFSYCKNLSNCTGKGVDSTDASNGFGFSNINYAVNCKDGGSSTDMWDGTNKNIDLDTCVKTLVTASNTTLNT